MNHFDGIFLFFYIIPSRFRILYICPNWLFIQEAIDCTVWFFHLIDQLTGSPVIRIAGILLGNKSTHPASCVVRAGAFSKGGQHVCHDILVYARIKKHKIRKWYFYDIFQYFTHSQLICELKFFRISDSVF